jgi:glycine betaine/proline transport system permease protein
MAAITAVTTAIRRQPSRANLAGVAVFVWALMYVFFRGHAAMVTSPTPAPQHLWVNGLRGWIEEQRRAGGVFTEVLDAIRIFMGTLVTTFQGLIARGDPIPQLGWLGVVALATFLVWLVGNTKAAALTAAGLTFLGLQGLWKESMDTLSLILASVLVALLFGIPLGVWAGLSSRFSSVITPVLDLMQTMPAFVYLTPLTLFFLIGPASAAIATMIYSVPLAIRITAHAIRRVPPTTVEASRSLGATESQSLRKVRLPMARRTIILGINQTMMAALAMVTIAALVDAPGLGRTVLKALQRLQIGTSFNGGLAIVVLAIVLDRAATAAGNRTADTSVTSTGPQQWWQRRRVRVGAAGAGVLAAIFLSRTYVWAAIFPTSVSLGGHTVPISVGKTIAQMTNIGTEKVLEVFGEYTNGFRDLFSATVLNGLQSMLTQTPWFATAALLITLAALAGGIRVAAIVTVSVALLVASGVWGDAMQTLAATLLATLIVVSLGVVVGVWIGLSSWADYLLRPVLHAAQVLPAFVYLVPMLALFGPTRFTGIVAAIIYATPVTVKIVADGIRGVSPLALESAIAAGSNTWQMITKVRLPMARSAIALATNQGLIFVLAMVVISGLVGGGALGYDVVAGFAQGEMYGKGLAAGLAIVLLGVILDRISQAVARRIGSGTETKGASGGG